MNVKIKSISLENFKGVKNATYKFDGKNTTISGANASGKTTIFDGVWWTLFNKDSLGSEKFSIRPLDKNSQPIHNVEIKATIILDVNGREMEFSKTQKEKWVKKRSSDVAELQGNENLYEIDGYPKTEKDYKQAIADIVSEDVFKMLTNPTHFTSLKWKDQRDILMRFVADVNDYDLASSEPRFSELLSEISKAPSLDDIKAKFQKALSEWKKKQAEIPVRIDEAEKSKVEIDVAELELGKRAIQELLKSNKEKREDVSKQYEEYNKATDGLMDLQFKLGDIVRNANANLVSQRADMDREVQKLEFELNTVKGTVVDCNLAISGKEKRIALNQEEIALQRDKWKAESERVFDDSSLVCPYCKQEYPQEQKDTLKAEFESHKAKELKAITERGNELKKQIDLDKAEIESFKEKAKDLEPKVLELEKQIEEVKTKLNNLPKSVDATQTDEYKEVQKQIDEKEEYLKGLNSADGIKKQLEQEFAELSAQLLDFERRIALADKNVEIDERIAELQAEQREVGQKVADQEKMLFLLEEFVRFKMDKVSADINGKFKLANFILFKNLINGGLVETCECEYNGVPYSSLNSAAKIQCGLDIIRSLQKLYDTYCPVFVDNRESCTDIPTMDCQVISMYVNPEYKEIKIES